MTESPNDVPADRGPSVPRPPAPPGPAPVRPVVTPADAARQADAARAAFGQHFSPMAARYSPFGVAEALLKTPARVLHELVHGRSARAMAAQLTVVVACTALYGFMMGMFSGGEQLWLVPVKVTAGMLLSGLICLPSLYIFACLSGSDRSIKEVTGILLMALALGAILLVGFAPVVWVFSHATRTAVFMGCLHLIFWGVGASFGLRLLARALSYVDHHETRALRLWIAVFVAVVLQMCTTLRPLVGEFRGYRLQDKQFFLGHWMESLERAR